MLVQSQRILMRCHLWVYQLMSPARHVLVACHFALRYVVYYRTCNVKGLLTQNCKSHTLLPHMSYSCELVNSPVERNLCLDNPPPHRMLPEDILSVIQRVRLEHPCSLKWMLSNIKLCDPTYDNYRNEWT